MSLYQDITHISVTGSKENVTRMLNAAICNAGTGNVIFGDDDLEIINLKIKEEDGCYGLRVALDDFFDEVCLQDAKLREMIMQLQGEQKDKSECEDENGYIEDDGEVNLGRMFDLLEVHETEDDYTVDIEIYECEAGYYGGWRYFEDIARLYQCRIVADDELFRNGYSLSLVQTKIWEIEDKEVKETIIRPDVRADDCKSSDDIDNAFAPLMQMDPQRYLKFKIRAYENLVGTLECETINAKASMEWYKTMEEEGIELSTRFKDFISSELFGGAEGVKKLHKRCIDFNKYSEEELAAIYQLRAKRLQDKDKELVSLYNQLLEHLHTDIEQKRKEKEERKSANGDDDENLPF